MLLVDLNGAWSMRAVGKTQWLDAKVPGSVYADLLRGGKMEDPFYRENETVATYAARRDYEYTRSFSVTGQALAHRHVLLRCEGLDTLCEVFLNGVRVLAAENMHRTYETDIRSALRQGENTVRVLFHSPLQYIEEKHAQLALDASTDTLHGFSHLRKAHCMFGWDWGPKLPDMGIWRGISVVGWDEARLDDVYITQTHTPGQAALSVRVSVQADAPVERTARVSVTGPDGARFSVEQTLADAGTLTLEIPNPRLWWPSGMGEHPLYTVQVELLDGTRALDSRTLRVGLRTLTVRTEPDAWGKSFAFTVNGVPFFAMGGDYIPEDSLFTRVTRQTTERLVQSCAQAHFNMLRVWGGGYYPDDWFYDLCDEYGLVVWQDLMYACAAYRFTDAFCENIAAETADNVRRIRHHACLGLWCGNNEMETAWVEWGWAGTFGPHLQADYIRQFESVLPRLMRQYDPQTFYWHSSPSSGGDFDDPNGEAAGDCHYWGVWHGLEPFTAFRTHLPRFMSEFGIQSFPCLKTVETFTRPQDRNIFTPVMEAHQKNSTANGKILHYISETFRYPRDFDSLLFASQLIQAEGIRCGVEHWRRNRGRCMGTLFWQVNDCWPVASWSSIDYYGRWKALHYAAKRFFAPVLLSACEEGTSVSLHVTNDSRRDVAGAVVWRLMDADSRPVREGRLDVSVPALSTRECVTLDFSSLLDTQAKRRGHFLAFSLEEGGEVLSRGTMLFVSPKYYELRDPHLALRVADAGDRYRIAVSARHYTRFVELSFAQADAVFSDNVFDLCGGEERWVEVSKETLPARAEEAAAQLRVRSLYDTYAHEEQPKQADGRG